ncbi:MAG: FtsX-like permease family protein, partial [Tannerellaceae bacterium]|nr:FtsX-like permease family protein [Tannerellaceae bacterium]
REIGIRKVFGSTTGQILSLFNKTYVCILCVCFLPAAILSHTIISEWMLNFAYRTPMHWWVYAAAFGSVTLLTVATVSLQNRRTASLNPSLTITES